VARICWLSNVTFHLTGELLAAAGAEAIAYSCGKDHTEAEASVFASAIATAFAQAVSSADGYCKSTDGSSACAWGSSSITAFAYAQASAFATAWAAAANGCNCKIEVEVITQAIQEIFVKAHTAVTADICSGAAPLRSRLSILRPAPS
jgi:hypothetical protein